MRPSPPWLVGTTQLEGEKLRWGQVKCSQTSWGNEKEMIVQWCTAHINVSTMFGNYPPSNLYRGCQIMWGWKTILSLKCTVCQGLFWSWYIYIYRADLWTAKLWVSWKSGYILNPFTPLHYHFWRVYVTWRDAIYIYTYQIHLTNVHCTLFPSFPLYPPTISPWYSSSIFIG